MTKSRRVMAVIVAALLIAAMILPGLVVKAEAAEGERTGEAGRVATKVTIESKDNKTLQYKPGESQKWTLVITNKTGRDLRNLSVSPDMGGEDAMHGHSRRIIRNMSRKLVHCRKKTEKIR